jgi:acetoin utilization protein AcuB
MTDSTRARCVPVDAVMTRDLITSGPETPLRTVLTRLTQHEIRHMPVVSESGVLIGIISKRDMLLAHQVNDGLVGPATASRLMTRETVTVQPDTCTTEAARIMFARRFGSLPVVDAADRLVGILTEADFVRLYRDNSGCGCVSPDLGA